MAVITLFNLFLSVFTLFIKHNVLTPVSLHQRNDLTFTLRMRQEKTYSTDDVIPPLLTYYTVVYVVVDGGVHVIMSVCVCVWGGGTCGATYLTAPAEMC